MRNTHLYRKVLALSFAVMTLVPVTAIFRPDDPGPPSKTLSTVRLRRFFIEAM
jgi:hypothetical protein